MLKTHLQVQYVVSRPTESDREDKPFTHAEKQTEEICERLRHLSALWGILRLIDLNRPWNRGASEQTLQELSETIGDYAELGTHITDGLFANLSELEDLQKK